MKKNIDQFFKNKLNVPRKAPSDSWDYIQNRLQQEDERGALPFWKKFMGVALILIFVSGAGWFVGKDLLFPKHSEKQQTMGLEQHNSNPDFQKIQSESTNESSGTSENSVGEADSESTNDFNSQIQNSVVLLTDTNNASYLAQNSNQDSYQELNIISNQNSTENYSYSSKTNHSLVDILTQQYSEKNDFYYPATPQFKPVDPSLLLDQINESSEKLFAVNDVKNGEKPTNEKKIKPKIDFDKFFVSGFVSPTALNTIVGRSMLSDELNEYKTENNITLAYGVMGAYAVSPKLRFRTGLSIVGFEQITKNVILTANLSGESAKISNNINYSGEIRLLENKEEFLESGDLSYRISDGDVQQQSQFIEIPVEAEYSVFQAGSIGVSVTGGASAWLLSKNRIYVQIEGHTEELGKADNLNNSWFSANAGLKFDLNVSDGVQFNVEPNFRYLMNPVSNVENYSSYTVGVNAGFTVKLK